MLSVPLGRQISEIMGLHIVVSFFTCLPHAHQRQHHNGVCSFSGLHSDKSIAELALPRVHFSIMQVFFVILYSLVSIPFIIRYVKLLLFLWDFLISLIILWDNNISIFQNSIIFSLPQALIFRCSLFIGADLVNDDLPLQKIWKIF